MIKKHQGRLETPALPDRLAATLQLNSSYTDLRTGKKIFYHVTRIPLGFSLMFGAGIISGLLGIGSGVLKVPAMDSAMRLPIKVSSATSSFMIGVTAAASAGIFYMRGDILPQLAGPVAVGALIGSWIGTILMQRMKAEKIRMIFIAVLLLIALQTFFRSFGIKLP